MRFSQVKWALHSSKGWFHAHVAAPPCYVWSLRGTGCSRSFPFLAGWDRNCSTPLSTPLLPLTKVQLSALWPVADRPKPQLPAVTVNGTTVVTPDYYTCEFRNPLPPPASPPHKPLCVILWELAPAFLNHIPRNTLSFSNRKSSSPTPVHCYLIGKAAAAAAAAFRTLKIFAGLTHRSGLLPCVPRLRIRLRIPLRLRLPCVPLLPPRALVHNVRSTRLRLCDQGVAGGGPYGGGPELFFFSGPNPSFRARTMMRGAQTATCRKSALPLGYGAA